MKSNFNSDNELQELMYEEKIKQALY